QVELYRSWPGNRDAVGRKTGQTSYNTIRNEIAKDILEKRTTPHRFYGTGLAAKNRQGKVHRGLPSGTNQRSAPDHAPGQRRSGDDFRRAIRAICGSSAPPEESCAILPRITTRRTRPRFGTRQRHRTQRGPMSGFLLDTNCISELIRPRPEPRVVDWME